MKKDEDPTWGEFLLIMVKFYAVVAAMLVLAAWVITGIAPWDVVSLDR